jgi:hypothetical protein
MCIAPIFKAHDKKENMNNETKIKGDGNFVFQGNKNSKINVESGDLKLPNKQNFKLIRIIISIIAFLVTLLVTIIIGWDNIIKFFTK